MLMFPEQLLEELLQYVVIGVIWRSEAQADGSLEQLTLCNIEIF